MAKAKINVYEIVTEQIIDRMAEGDIPWSKPWKCHGDRPSNLLSKKPYRGINVWLLAMTPYTSKWWLTFKQAKKLGGTVRKGEKSTLVVFWKILEKKSTEPKGKRDPDAAPDNYAMLRYYRVFNVEQCDGLEDKIPAVEEEREIEERERAAQIVAAMKARPEIRHGGDVAAYSPFFDKVAMPMQSQFEDDDAYYGTLFHELVHATGHESRLKRFAPDEAPSFFGSESYSKEELVAELGASFLSAVAGLNWELNRSAAYIQNWMRKLKKDPKLIVQAAARAQKASDFILGES